MAGRTCRLLALDPAIAAAGGKALDPWLRVRNAGALIGADGYRMIDGGRADYSPTQWFIGEVVSDVDALPTPPIAARRDPLLAAGG
ncbi:hypothetical protein [Sphingomonas sp.]|uniref:hypothetical protein n=1 Tax=Sphingomonas sp. TaxID=28214 RepID=UPI003AFF84D5